MFSKTTILMLLPLILLVDIAAIMSLMQDLHPDSNAEIIFLFLSFLFLIFSTFILSRKDKTKGITNRTDESKEITNSADEGKDSIPTGRF